jgi:hypothetical protein
MNAASPASPRSTMCDSPRSEAAATIAGQLDAPAAASPGGAVTGSTKPLFAADAVLRSEVRRLA